MVFFRCHRSVLYSSGGIFSKILIDSDVDTNVVICDATRDDLNNLIDFVYTGNVTFESKLESVYFLSFIGKLGIETPQYQDIRPTEPLQPQQHCLHLHDDDKQEEQQKPQHNLEQRQPQHHQEQHQQKEQEKSLNEWNSSSNHFPSIMTDLLGDVPETLPDLVRKTNWLKNFWKYNIT